MHIQPQLYHNDIGVLNEKFVTFIHLHGRSILLFLLMSIVLTTAKTEKK